MGLMGMGGAIGGRRWSRAFGLSSAKSKRKGSVREARWQDPATCNIQRFGGFAETSILIHVRT